MYIWLMFYIYIIDHNHTGVDEILTCPKNMTNMADNMFGNANLLSTPG